VNLHRTPLALDPGRVDANAAMAAVSNPATGGSGSFVAGRVMNQVARSAYGRRLPTNSTRDIGPTRNLGGARVDEGEKKAIEQRIAAARVAIAALQEQQALLGQEERAINEENRGYQKKYVRAGGRWSAVRN
jgi:hypothetical protein